MNPMKSFFVFILFIIFFFSSQLAVFSFFITGTLKPDYIKEHLRTSGIYTTAANEIPKIASPQGGDVQNPEQEKTTNFLKKEITPDYIQEKAEKFVDEGYSWLSGKTENPPAADLTDLKVKIGKDFPSQAVPDDINKVFSKPLEVKPNKFALEVRKYLQIFQNSFIPVLAISLISLVGIVFLSVGLKSRMHKVSLALVLPSVFGLFVSIVVLFLISLAVNAAADSIKSSQFGDFSISIKSFLNPIVGNLSLELLTAFVSGLALSLLIFFSAIFIKEKEVKG